MDLLLASAAENASNEAANPSTAAAEPSTTTKPNKQATGSGSGSTAARVSRPKKVRQAPATFACERCRRLHEKCDGFCPCQRCEARGKECEYRDGVVRPSKMQKRQESPEDTHNSPTTTPIPQPATSFHHPFSQLQLHSQPQQPHLPMLQPPLLPSMTPQPLMGAVGGGGALAAPAPMLHFQGMGMATLAPVSEQAVALYPGLIVSITRLASDRGRALRLINDVVRHNNPNIQKWLKYQTAFLSESGGFYANLHVPDYASLASAIAPVLTLTTADELCDAAEHLTIIATGAMMIADRDTWSTLSKRATQILDRLINEFSHRALTDLFYRGAVARALLALSYFLAGEILDGVALLDNISQYNRLWESDPMSAQLLLQVHALRWSQLGDQRDLDIARRVCASARYARPMSGLMLAHGIRRVHSENQSAISASRTLFNEVGDFEALKARIEWENDRRVIDVALHAPRSIICLDVRLLQEAKLHAMIALGILQGLSPQEDASFVIPVSLAIVMKVFTHLGEVVQTDICRALMRQWVPYYPIAGIWLQLVPELYSFTQNASFQQLFDQPADDAWSKAAAAAGLDYNDDIGLFLGPLSPGIS